MKIKFLFLSLIILLFSSNAFAANSARFFGVKKYRRYVIHIASSQISSKKQINEFANLVFFDLHKYCPNVNLYGNTTDVILNTVTTGNKYLYSSCINVVKGYHGNIRKMTCSLYYAENILNSDKLQFIKDRIKGNIKAYCKR